MRRPPTVLATRWPLTSGVKITRMQIAHQPIGGAYPLGGQSPTRSPTMATRDATVWPGIDIMVRTSAT